MFVAKYDTVRLEGTVENAKNTRKLLLEARDLLPEGEVRDEIIALAIHLQYAIEEVEKKVDWLR